MANRAKIAISLVAWNGKKYLADLMGSIFNQTFKDFEILIIDNGSTDGTAEFFEKNYPELRLIKNKENVGFAKGQNMGISKTQGEYVLVLNQDLILEADFLEKLADVMDKNPRAGSAGGKLLRLKDGQKTNLIDSICHKIFKTHQVIELGSGQEDKGQYNETKQVFGVSATAPFYRRSALEEVKFDNEYFDEDFFSYKEDVDLSYRLRLYGWQSWYVPEAKAYHDRSAVGVKKGVNLETANYRKKKSEFINFHSYKNHFFILIKNLTAYNLFWCFPYIFGYELIKFFYILFFEPKTLKALPVVFQKLSRMKKKRRIIIKNKKISDKKLFKWFG